jgi:hypothetical protein
LNFDMDGIILAHETKLWLPTFYYPSASSCLEYMYTVSVFKHNNLKIIILTLLCDIHWHVDLSLTIQLLCDILRILLRHFCGTWKFGVESVSSASVQC